MKQLLDIHAPQQKKLLTVKVHSPWINHEIRCEIRHRRALERKWRSTGLMVHRGIYREQRTHVTNLIAQSKRTFYNEKFADSSKDSKSLFKTVDRLLNKNSVNQLPTGHTCSELAEKFVNFFHDKIIKIQSSFSNKDSTVLTDYELPNLSSSLSSFELATQEEVRLIMQKSLKKTCVLDPLPTCLLMECLPGILPTVTQIINLSISSSCFPPSLKDAIVTPLLKKSSLDPDEFKNFRPVSNLPYISKLIERVIASRLNKYMSHNNLYEVYQSAYRKMHSTETALVRVQNDVLRSLDDKKCVLLLLLDLSSAFDTVCHPVLLSRLSSCLGICGTALSWFASYLAERHQAVQVGRCTSENKDLQFGVPQGSVLGPILFSIYTLPLGEIMRRHNVSFHLFADDTQIFLSFNFPEFKATCTQMENCIKDIRSWMTANYLKLNSEKTEMLFISSRFSKIDTSFCSLNFAGTIVRPTPSVCNIGAIFDSSLSLESHVNRICRSSYLHLRNLGAIRKYLTRSTAATLANAFISSKLDYLNALLVNLPDQLINKLQRIQNTAARIVTLTKRNDHITPVLASLHWLPVRARISFKVCLMILYRILHDQSPEYLKEIICVHEPTRQLRSAQNGTLLSVPRVRTAFYGDRAFSAAAPAIWNVLPNHVRLSATETVFRKWLKTPLFRQYFM